VVLEGSFNEKISDSYQSHESGWHQSDFWFKVVFLVHLSCDCCRTYARYKVTYWLLSVNNFPYIVNPCFWAD